MWRLIYITGEGEAMPVKLNIFNLISCSSLDHYPWRSLNHDFYGLKILCVLKSYIWKGFSLKDQNKL